MITFESIHERDIRNDMYSIYRAIEILRYVVDYKDDYMKKEYDEVLNYIVKLEREVCGLREYKKHQDRANERRFHASDEPWHRGSIVEKKK